MTYKKLFPIQYNNKKFMLFLDENNRITFLEQKENSEYEYPMLEDFIALTKMFNNHDSFICYRIPKFTFNECVKTTKNGVLTILSVITIINSMPTALAAEAKIENKSDSSITVTIDSLEQEKQEIIIEDLDDLNKYLGHLDVTQEMVIEAIDNNPSMNNRFKRLAKELLNMMKNLDPNTNLRIFYENVKTMQINEYTIEEFRKKFPQAPGGTAQYNCYLNAITTIDYEDDETLLHELYHAYNNLYFETSDKVIVRYDKNTGLNEAMTDKGIGSKYGYVFAREVANYLASLVDYKISDYNAKGTKDLINRLKTKYPDVDIDYINETLNAYNKNCIAQGHTVKIDDMKDFADELFNICLREANLNSGYKPFNNFARIFSNAKNPKLVFEYFEKYNERLKEIGYSNIRSESEVLTKLSIYNNIIGIGTSNNTVYPIARGEKEGYLKINSDGTTSPIVISSGVETKGILSQMSSTIFAYYDIFGTDKYWYELNENASYISPHNIYAIPIYNEGKLITTAMPRDLNIQIGLKGEDIGFIISDKNGDIIFKTDDKLTNISNLVVFSDYINLVPSYITKVELEDILNVRHLRNFQRMYPNDNFKNLNNENGGISINEENSITIEEENTTTIYDGKKMIGKSNLNELYLQVGETKDKKIGFILINKQGEMIYSSSPEIINLSNPVVMAYYVDPTLNSLYLSDYFNEEYLKKFQKETKLFYNIEIDGDKVVIDTSPLIDITRYENEKEVTDTYRISKCNIYIINGNIIISDSNIPPVDAERVIKLEDILTEFGILKNDVPRYQLSLEAINELINESLENSNRRK